jgi:hypothetical protein
MEEVVTAARSPWQNPYAERLIGSIRRACLNHFVMLECEASEQNARKIYRISTIVLVLIWGSTSRVPFLDGCRVSEGSSKSHSWEVYITAMNALQHSSTDVFSANHRCRISELHGRISSAHHVRRGAGFRLFRYLFDKVSSGLLVDVKDL